MTASPEVAPAPAPPPAPHRVAIFSVVSTALLMSTLDSTIVAIALRAIQAAGGAGFTPSATGIITDNFGESRDKAVGLFGSMFPIGSMIGPVFGGLFVSYWSWRGIFFVNVPIGILLAVFCLRYVPPDPRRRENRERPPADWPGMALLGTGTLALMLAVSYLGESGASAASPWFIAPLVIGLGGLAAFGRHIRHTAHPFIAPRLIAGRGFGAVNVINILYGGAVAGMLALIPLYAVTRYHISALGSGTLLTAEGISVIVLSTLAVMTLRRTGYRWPLYIGSALIAAGMAGLAFRPGGISPYLWLASAACVIGIGSGVSAPASRNAGLQLAPDQSAGLAALRSTGRQVGQIAAVSVTAAIIAQSAEPGPLQAKVFIAFAVVLVVCLPVIGRVTEHRGSW